MVAYPGMKLPCETCGISCCSEFTVYLNSADLFRFCRVLQINPQEAVRLVPLGKGNADYREYAFSLGGPQTNLLALRRNRSYGVLKNNNRTHGSRALERAQEPCVFLMRLASTGRCGIHASRPDVCRCYPFSFERRFIRQIPQSLCQEAWDLDASGTEQFRDQYQEMKRHFFRYQALLDTWHAEILPALMPFKQSAKDRLEAFFRFLESREDAWETLKTTEVR